MVNAPGCEHIIEKAVTASDNTLTLLAAQPSSVVFSAGSTLSIFASGMTALPAQVIFTSVDADGKEFTSTEIALLDNGVEATNPNIFTVVVPASVPIGEYSVTVVAQTLCHVSGSSLSVITLNNVCYFYFFIIFF